MTRFRRRRSRGSLSSAGTSRCSFPSTRTSRPAGRRRTRGGQLPRKYAHTLDLFVAVTAAATVTSRLRVGLRRVPGDRAGPDRHRQGGRQRGRAVGRALRVRRGRRVEQGGDGQPRHRPAGQDGGHAGAGRGDEGDLGVRRGELCGRARAVRADLVVAEARAAAAPAGAGRRATGPACSTGCSRSATRWFPNYAPAGILDRGKELRARADRPVALMVMGIPADPRVIEAYAAGGFRAGGALAAFGRRGVRWSGSSTLSRPPWRSSPAPDDGALPCGPATRSPAGPRDRMPPKAPRPRGILPASRPWRDMPGYVRTRVGQADYEYQKVAN